MKRITPACLLSALLLFTGTAAEPHRLTVALDAPAKPISPDLFGIFFEDLNYAADGGLYAELLQNRSFEYSPTEQAKWGPLSFWDLVKTGAGEGHLGLGNSRPVHANNPHYLLLNVTQAGDGVGVANLGFDQIPLVAGQAYEVSFFAYQAYMGIMWGPGDQTKPMPVTVRLEGADGRVLAEAKFEISGRTWTKHTATLTPAHSEPAARFVLLAHAAGGVALDMVSLFPHDTFQGRANGLRRDLAQTIADLRPRFVRFPGGCLVHGTGIHAYYDWKDTVGPLEQRRAARNSWGYHQTMGIGYYEYFQFCADIGAAPLPVVTAGVCCQHAGHSPGRGQEGLPLAEMPAYIQDILDLIEWANGPADSKWGAVRAAAGHPAPFGLKYLGVGNEDAITPEFKERFTLINDVLKAKHPEITVIGTSGPFASGEDFDKGWAFARELNLALVDEHYYVPPQWMWDNLARYDTYDRAGPKVYVGEYAAHEKDRRNTLRTALAEAAHLTSLERNGDQVVFSSFAPLLARRQHTQWTPDLIYFTGTEVFPSLNYTVQKLFGHNAGDAALPTTLAPAPAGTKLAASTVRDSRSGDIILKLVNGEPTAQTVAVNLAGAGPLPATAQRTVFGGADADVANTDGQPPAVVPVTTTVPLAAAFTYEAPANSLTLLRFPGR
ncbi:Extracellular exo-alpha-L-arabinofuranosidase precursor [Lacunisphaera limnophila]|uniref:non-reducing end alpha-L-arabinofuranosidase n=1 Tax=Lacunisphaera limnophila TaxID=1838286 RepID=A0A1D8ATL6_9BACT|nr:alpha-L-arabinofuranosidase C-terminal domain-containing protein [Lacunisphaera limnophila]AOS44227.1 Extracellular exo-alpha-L-arabinofuranosidase precursor [Lacunisphaera limnophila]